MAAPNSNEAQRSLRKTRIVVTIGPASSSRETIRELIESGMNVARLNFSHGTWEEHSKILQTVRDESAKLGIPVAVFQDLCGPKIRISEIENNEFHLETGHVVILKKFSGEKGTTSTLYVEAIDPALAMKPGHTALLVDGQVQLSCLDTTDTEVRCLVTAGGKLRSRCGIAFPDSKSDLPCLTEKDLHDLDWGIAKEIDYIALSFVSSAEDIRYLKQEITKRGANIPVIAKIERATCLDQIDEIVGSTDAVMVARGDLGLELPLERVPGAQKVIISTANQRARPVITATQMLTSMVKERRPTRAEVSDVYTAVRDGTDAVMLSEETALGDHPIEAVKVLDRIIREAENELLEERAQVSIQGPVESSRIADAVCYAAVGAAHKISAAAVLACTVTGFTARLMSKYRPRQVLFGATSEKKTLARMALYRGVEPLFINIGDGDSTEDEVTQAMIAVRDRYGIKPGSIVVITAGLRTKTTGTTNLLEIREIPRRL